MKFSFILFVFQLLILDAVGSQYEDEFFRNLIDLENSMPTPTDKPSETTTSTPTVAPTIACESIVTVLCSVPEFSTLCTLVDFTGLGDALNENTFTIFAPVNDAFDAIEARLANTEPDADTLRNILLYHAVADTKILADDLVCDTNVMMANSEETKTVCIDNEIFQVGNGNSDPLPKIIATDGISCNGIVHAIDQVMLPGEDLPETDAPTLAPTNATKCESLDEIICSLPEFETLCALLGDAELLDDIGGDEVFTIFAPVNSAFESLPEELANTVTSDPELLAKVLLSHAVSGEIFSVDLECGAEVFMVSGEETTTVCIEGQIFQSGAGNTFSSLPKIVASDGVSCNGVIHAVDQIILPPL